MEDSSTVEGKVTSSSASEQTEEPEWLIPKQQQLQSDDIDTNSDITSLFSAGKTSTTVASKAPLIVDLNENSNTGDTPDFAQSNSLSELMLPLEITPSSTNKTLGRRPLIEEIDDSVSDDFTNLLVDSCNKEGGGPTSFFITESNVSKAASFYSTTSEEPESTPTEFGGQWAERTRPLIEEMECDNPTKTEMAKVEVIEDLEDIETPQLYSEEDQSANAEASQPVSENGRKESLHDAITSSEGEINRITELAEKAGSTLDPVTMDQALLQSLRQKYQ